MHEHKNLPIHTWMHLHLYRLLGDLSNACTHLCDREIEKPLSLVAESCLLLTLFQVLHQPSDLIGNLASFVKVCTT